MASDEVMARLVAGRYNLHELIGRGGMGSVWRAEDVLLERPVAVKRVELPASLSPEERESLRKRVLREARAAARVSHPHLVTIFDVVEEGDTVFLVQELVDAPTLKALVSERGPFEPEQAARLGRSLLEGLAAAHRSGVVHRDVKPGNVMVLDDGGVKLADFGIASITGDPHLTTTGMIIGSPAYMAPEQATGAEVTAAVDVWALGATLYFAVEGEPPFGKTDSISTLTSVVHDPPRQPLRAGPLGAVLERLLDKDPARRPTVAQSRELLALPAADRPPADRRSAADRPPADRRSAADRPPADRRSAADRRPAATVDGGPHLREEPRPPEPGAERAFRQRRGLGLVTALVALALVAGLALTSLVGEPPSGDRRADPASPAETAGDQPSPTAEQGPGVPAGWQTYQDPETGYRVEYPDGWTVRKRDETRTDFSDPATGSYLRVDWTDEPGPSPEGAWQALSQDFARRKANYREIRIEPTSYKGHRAALWEYSYVEGDASLHAYNLGFVTPKFGFALNFQTSESRFASAQPLWERLKEGFVIPEEED